MVLAARFARRAPRAIVPFSIAVVAGAAPWWLKNTWLLGTPFAPIGWHRAGIETLWRDAASNMNLAVGGADLIARVGSVLGRSGILVVPLALVALVLCFADRRATKLLVLAVAVLGWIAWALTGALDRFLPPTIALLLAVAAASGRRGWARSVAVTAIVSVLAWGGFASLKFGAAIGGSKMAGEAEEVYAANVVSDPSPAFRACARLEPDARLLLVGEPRGFLLPRRFE